MHPALDLTSSLSRYQIMRHARKLGGRAFAPNYRLAPQYPFPCGLLDALASYLFLISPPPGAEHKPVHPSCILFAGDSAGAGMVVSLLTMLRDLGLEQPAGAVLLSPWVDLTHSFPSIMHNAKTDYIPGEGFHYRPSLAWPPERGTVLEVANVDGKEPLLIDEQIQLYCPNLLLTHPLVSPVNQGSLGGLCPLLVVSALYMIPACRNPNLTEPLAYSTLAAESYCEMSKSTSRTRRLVQANTRLRQHFFATIPISRISGINIRRRQSNCRSSTAVLMSLSRLV